MKGKPDKQSGNLKTWSSECCSFIHSKDLYSAPSTLLLRSAPDPSTAEKDSFEARIERFRVDSAMQSQCQREPIPEGGANHCYTVASELLLLPLLGLQLVKPHK